MRRLGDGAGCGARAQVSHPASGTPWVCRPPQLSGAAQSKGLDAGRTNAGQSPREQGGLRSFKDRKPVCPRPGSTVPGSENAAMMERRKARVSLSGGRDALRCCREAASETETLRFAALRPPHSWNEGRNGFRRPRAANNRGDDARLCVIGVLGCLTIASRRRGPSTAFNPPHGARATSTAPAPATSRRLMWHPKSTQPSDANRI